MTFKNVKKINLGNHVDTVTKMMHTSDVESIWRKQQQKFINNWMTMGGYDLDKTFTNQIYLYNVVAPLLSD